VQSPPPPPEPPPGYMPAPTSLAPQGYAGQTTYAGFWIRVAARLVDSLILGIPFTILFSVFAIGAGVFAGNANTDNQKAQGAVAVLFGGVFLLVYLLALLVTFGYWIYFWGKTGETLGMRLFRLRVIDANTGALIGYGRATIRLLMTFINTWACYLGWIWVAFDPRKQGWHDKVANSVVVRY
jgi:uncharacterized RDD family membrane protein YckC